METLVSKCPFLARVSTNFLKRAGQSLVSYANNCPVMSLYMTEYASYLFHTQKR